MYMSWKVKETLIKVYLEHLTMKCNINLQSCIMCKLSKLRGTCYLSSASFAGIGLQVAKSHSTV